MMFKSILLSFIIFSSICLSKAQNVGYATNYTSSPAGMYYACGVPKDLLETQNFVALNVFDSPGNYNNYQRPITGTDLQYLGEFSNGANCGRWLKVTIGPNCTGINDGAQNQPFCRGTGAKLVDDKYSGATLYMLVADACADQNAWCRDSPFHLDLFQSSLNIFEKNGVTVNDMYPKSFNNRQISWEYTPAPDYSGDINIYFTVNAQIYYPAIMINNLPNGIHKVEQKVGSNWITVPMNSDLGQQFTLDKTVTTYRIRIYDADDQLLNNGREYIFTFPKACGSLCTGAATPATYQTFDPIPTSVEEEDFFNLKNGFYTSTEDGLLFLHKKEGGIISDFEVSLLDMNGRILSDSEISFSANEKTKMIAKLNKGLYLLKIKTVNGPQTFNLKINN